MLFQKSVHHLGELRLFRRSRQLLHGAVLVVRDAEAVEEITQQLLLRADEPDLQQVRSHALVLLAPECVAQPREPLQLRLPLDEDRAQFALLAERLDRRLHQRLLVVGDVGKKLR